MQDPYALMWEYMGTWYVQSREHPETTVPETVVREAKNMKAVRYVGFIEYRFCFKLTEYVSTYDINGNQVKPGRKSEGKGPAKNKWNKPR